MSLEKPLIELDGVDFSYGAGAPVLQNFSVSIRKGEYLGIIGPNGGGKTTLLKIILGLLHPDQGTVKLFGKDSHDFKERHRIGYVPQRATQADKGFPATVFEVVKSGRTARLGFLRPFGQEDLAVVERVMELAGIARYRDTLEGDLSGGERQRVFIARALAGEPEVLILDEPTVGVDIGVQKTFYDFLTTLNRDHHITIIFVSHDVDAISREAMTLLCVNHNLVCYGPSNELLNDHAILESLYGEHNMKRLHEHA